MGSALDALIRVFACASVTFWIATTTIGLYVAAFPSHVGFTFADIFIIKDRATVTPNAILSPWAFALITGTHTRSSVVPGAAVIPFPVLVALTDALVVPMGRMDTYIAFCRI